MVKVKKWQIVVIMSLEQYDQIMKAAHNAEYLAMIDRSMDQLSS